MTRVEYSDKILEPETIKCLNKHYAGTMEFWKEKSEGANMRLHIDAWFKNLKKDKLYSIDFKHYGYHEDGDHSQNGAYYAEIATTNFEGIEVKGSLYGSQDFFLLAASWSKTWYIVRRADLKRVIEANTYMNSMPAPLKYWSILGKDEKLFRVVESRRKGGKIVFFDPEEEPTSTIVKRLPNLFDMYQVIV